MEDAFLTALHDHPGDEVTWLALADWLEENGQSDRAELVRLVRQSRALPLLRRTKPRRALEERIAALLQAGVRPVAPEVTNSLGMRLALIPADRFRMGSPAGEKGRLDDEAAREVEITRPFYLGVFPVTQAQYEAVVGRNPSHFCRRGSGRDRVEGMDTSQFPVDRVSWHQAGAFCKKLSALAEEKLAKRKYRLPTEAEWEYACRGGSASTTAYSFGPTISVQQANINMDSAQGDPKDQRALHRTCVVGSYLPNVFGLYNMHGNVWEWCSDWHDDDYPLTGESRDPQGPPTGTYRIIRGGSWGARPPHCRAARRHACQPGDLIYGFGFRVVMTRS